MAQLSRFSYVLNNKNIRKSNNLFTYKWILLEWVSTHTSPWSSFASTCHSHSANIHNNSLSITDQNFHLEPFCRLDVQLFIKCYEQKTSRCLLGPETRPNLWKFIESEFIGSEFYESSDLDATQVSDFILALCQRTLGIRNTPHEFCYMIERIDCVLNEC